jgi:aspartyl-tRNA(Asn)/glutamyl-tRNA(Gln) amidotransferase subunit C
MFRSTIRDVSPFTADDVRRLARLARLDLNDDEVSAFTRQLGDILEFARQIQSVDTTTVTAPAAPTVAPLREDAACASLSRHDVLSATPDHDAATGLIKVPRVISSGGSEPEEDS